MRLPRENGRLASDQSPFVTDDDVPVSSLPTWREPIESLLPSRTAMTPFWARHFPRLDDLYSISTHRDSHNYFEHPNVRAALERQDSYLVQLESVLEQMDTLSWNEFKSRTAPYVAAQDKWGWFSQLFDRFHEARAYAFLKTEGCQQISWIPETPGRETPDLCAVGPGGAVLVEAKRIRESDDENEYFTIPPDQKEAKEILHTLSDPLRAKIRNTVSKAQRQLFSYPADNAHKRILYLAIRLDLTQASKRVAEELARLLGKISDESALIVHYVENEFLI